VTGFHYPSTRVVETGLKTVDEDRDVGDEDSNADDEGDDAFDDNNCRHGRYVGLMITVLLKHQSSRSLVEIIYFFL